MCYIDLSQRASPGPRPGGRIWFRSGPCQLCLPRQPCQGSIMTNPCQGGHCNSQGTIASASQSMAKKSVPLRHPPTHPTPTPTPTPVTPVDWLCLDSSFTADRHPSHYFPSLPPASWGIITRWQHLECTRLPKCVITAELLDDFDTLLKPDQALRSHRTSRLLATWQLVCLLRGQPVSDLVVPTALLRHCAATSPNHCVTSCLAFPVVLCYCLLFKLFLLTSRSSADFFVLCLFRRIVCVR